MMCNPNQQPQQPQTTNESGPSQTGSSNGRFWGEEGAYSKYICHDHDRFSELFRALHEAQERWLLRQLIKVAPMGYVRDCYDRDPDTAMRARKLLGAWCLLSGVKYEVESGRILRFFVGGELRDTLMLYEIPEPAMQFYPITTFYYPTPSLSD
jgi:hypothetical protein